METEGGIDPDAPLDYVELQIFPTQNRYEACIWSGNRAKNVASGTLEQLLLHSPQVKELSSKGSNTNFKILPPDNVNDGGWFTTTTLTRFLHIVGSPHILSIGNEISQLEETRKFQISLSVKAEVDLTSSVESKNELLRAVDLRLMALKEELADAFDQAIGSRCSTKDISDLENFAHHFGAEDIRDSLQKFVEISPFPSVDNKTETSAPPIIVAQVEQDSSNSENSSFSSDDNQPSVERSRTLTRSATPRRSASPMRRIQIGRSGSRKPAALTIKSLNYFPAREKTIFQRDKPGNSSEEEETEKPVKNNVLRMSVQDKISLFESKQRDQGTDVPKPKILLGAKKAVLRRWSSGMGESAKNIAPAAETEADISMYKSGVCVETEEKINNTPQSPERLDMKMDDLEHEGEESSENCEKHPSAIEWNQQKEVELNQLFTKMMESKPVRSNGNMTNDINKSKKSLKEERGGFYDHYKQKRDEKLREKEEQFKKKAEMASTNVIDVNKKHMKPQKTQKNSTPLTNPRKESSAKPSLVKKTTSKLSPLPATRKSWPSTPSPRATGAPPARTTTPTSRKPQSASSLVRSSTKVEKSLPRSKTPNPTQPIKKTVIEKKQPIATKNTKIAKAKVRTPEVDTKPSFYNKVTKKSSVVPLETKPFLRKGSGSGPGVGPVIKTKPVAQSDSDLTRAEENEVALTSNLSQTKDECEAPENLEPQVVNLSPTKCEESVSCNSNHYEDLKRTESSEIKTGNEDEIMISPTAWVENEIEENHQEEIIIPCSESPVQIEARANNIVPAGISSPRVRHSLSQMLLEEISEGDIGEWGNAEHPPALVYQKDSPKGLKRLLKFARKTDDAEELKGQSNISRFNAQNHQKIPDGHVSASMNTTKATRSFFSLSALRGSKTNDNAKLHQRKRPEL